MSSDAQKIVAEDKWGRPTTACSGRLRRALRHDRSCPSRLHPHCTELRSVVFGSQADLGRSRDDARPLRLYGGWPRARGPTSCQAASASVATDHTHAGISITGISPRSTAPDYGERGLGWNRRAREVGHVPGHDPSASGRLGGAGDRRVLEVGESEVRQA